MYAEPTTAAEVREHAKRFARKPVIPVVVLAPRRVSKSFVRRDWLNIATPGFLKSSSKKTGKIEHVKEAILKVTQTSAMEFCGPSQAKKIVEVRLAFFRFCREFTSASNCSIAKHSNRHASTVWKSFRMARINSKRVSDIVSLAQVELGFDAHSTLSPELQPSAPPPFARTATLATVPAPMIQPSGHLSGPDSVVMEEGVGDRRAFYEAA